MKEKKMAINVSASTGSSLKAIAIVFIYYIIQKYITIMLILLFSLISIQPLEPVE